MRGPQCWRCKNKITFKRTVSGFVECNLKEHYHGIRCICTVPTQPTNKYGSKFNFLVVFIGGKSVLPYVRDGQERTELGSDIGLNRE
jgi:hypothetical protein